MAHRIRPRRKYDPASVVNRINHPVFHDKIQTINP